MDSFFEDYSRFRINIGDLVFALTRPIISTGIKASIVNDVFDQNTNNLIVDVLQPRVLCASLFRTGLRRPSGQKKIKERGRREAAVDEELQDATRSPVCLLDADPQ